MTRLIVAVTMMLFLQALTLPGARAVVGSEKYENWEELMLTGMAAKDRGDNTQSEACFKEALSCIGGDTSKEVQTLDELEALYEETENYKAAVQTAHRIIECIESIPDYPANLIGATYLQLASLHYFLNDFSKVRTYTFKAIDILRKDAGYLSPTVGIALNNLGFVEYQLKQLTASEKHLRQSLYVTERTLGCNSIFYGMTATNLACLYERQGKLKSASLWYERACTSLNAALGSDASLCQEVAARHRAARAKMQLQKNRRKPAAVPAKTFQKPNSASQKTHQPRRPSDRNKMSKWTVYDTEHMTGPSGRVARKLNQVRTADPGSAIRLILKIPFIPGP